jgi:hypothetical protein
MTEKYVTRATQTFSFRTQEEHVYIGEEKIASFTSIDQAHGFVQGVNYMFERFKLKVPVPSKPSPSQEERQ